MDFIIHNFKQIFFITIFSLSILNANYIDAQQIKVNERDSVIVTVKEIITSNRYCILITINEIGIPHARTMDPFPVEDDFVIWFGTNRNSRKVKDIKHNQNVTVYYTTPDWEQYVAIEGKAQLIDNEKVKKEKWKKEWNAFYPNKSKNYILIKVTPIKLNVLSEKHGLKINSDNWRIPHINFNK